MEHQFDLAKFGTRLWLRPKAVPIREQVERQLGTLVPGDTFVVDAGRVRFQLTEPWPDFMTFYGTSASGAAWIVPKKYVEKVGDDGFLKAPIGAGPYRVESAPTFELLTATSRRARSDVARMLSSALRLKRTSVALSLLPSDRTA